MVRGHRTSPHALEHWRRGGDGAGHMSQDGTGRKEAGCSLTFCFTDRGRTKGRN